MFPLPLHVNDVMSSASWPIKGIVAGDREKAASRMLPDFWGGLRMCGVTTREKNREKKRARREVRTEDGEKSERKERKRALSLRPIQSSLPVKVAWR